MLKKLLKKLPKLVSKIIGHVSFVFITLIGYAFFYHEKNLFANLGKLFGIGTASFTSDYTDSMIYENGLLLIAALICVTPLGHTLFEALRNRMRRDLGFRRAYAVDRVIKTVIILLLVALCTLRLAGDSYNPFIDFKF